MSSEARFNDVDDLARFCATLAREGVIFNVQPGAGHGWYVVTIESAEAK